MSTKEKCVSFVHRRDVWKVCAVCSMVKYPEKVLKMSDLLRVLRKEIQHRNENKIWVLFRVKFGEKENFSFLCQLHFFFIHWKIPPTMFRAVAGVCLPAYNRHAHAKHTHRYNKQCQERRLRLVGAMNAVIV